MFNSLSGVITAKLPQKIYLDTNGIEWDITVPDTCVDSLPSVGSKAKVYVWMQHTEQAMTLYGFSSESDRTLFFDLLKVDGVGPKSAVKIMSSIARQQLISSLDSGDLAALEKVPGLGKKTAQKMLLALKGKLTLDEEVQIVVKRSGTVSEFADVITALSNMGYEKRDVEAVISRLVQEFNEVKPEPGEVAFKDKTPSQKEDMLFKRAIVELAQ